MGAQAQSIMLISNFFKIMDKGVFIPSEFYKDKNLKGLERDVLALYKYYTENGTSKCCSLNSVQIAEYFNVSSRYIKSVRQHLKELGYIKTDGGIKVIYVGIKGEPQFPQEGTTVPHRGSHSSPQRGATVPPKGEPQFPHKKEKKDKKEIKKEEKRIMTNFEQLLGKLPKDYLTEEKISYMKEHYMDKINDVDMSDGGFESWITGIKIELNKIFPQEYKVEKKEPVPVCDVVDMF